MNTLPSHRKQEESSRRFCKNLEMLNPHAAGLDLHKEKIWVCPGGFEDNREPEVNLNIA